MRVKISLSIIFIIFNLPFNIIFGNEKIKNIFTNIKNKEWDIGMRAAKLVGDEALIKIVLSQRLLDSNYTRNSFEEIINFINQNPHWPQIDKLKVKAESYLNNKSDKNLILNWFNSNKPRTSAGYRYYALAAAEAPSNKNTNSIIKSSLINGDFTLEEQKKYFSEYTKHIDEGEYVARFSEYLWKEQLDSARKILPLINPGYVATFNACQAAIDNKNNKIELFNAVNPKYHLKSLIYHYLKSKKKERPTLADVKLFNSIKYDGSHGDKLGTLQLYYAREFLDYHEYNNSYAAVANNLAKGDEIKRDIEWLAGWLNLRHLNNPKLALKHFEKFLEISKKPISVARGEYWLARTYSALKNNKSSAEHFAKAAKYSYTFYGQLSLDELGQSQLILPAAPKIYESHRKKFENDQDIKVAKLWVKYGSFEMAHLYGRAAMEKAQNPEDAALIANYIVSNHNQVFQGVMIAKEASYHNAFIKEYAYPTPYDLSKSPVDPAFAYAIMRQESVFHPSVISSAGAMGLMQLIKTTACGQAKAMGIKCDIKKLLQDANYNILIGTNHLKHLLGYRKGSYVLAIASYNADPRKVDRWVKLFGDPRKMNDLHKVIDWMELIPFSETRNYVQRVIEAVQVYHTIINKNNKLTIRDYLLNK